VPALPARSRTGSLTTVAHLKTELRQADPYVAQFTDELTDAAGAPFADRLAAAPVLPTRTGVL
jgi:hypothetical protein